MATPRHRTAPGTSYFVTTRCWQGRAIFQVPEIADILVKTLSQYRDEGAYLLHEFVVMPDHLHLLVTPGPTTSLEKTVQLIKGGSSHRIHKERNQKMEIWQEGFYDWTVRDADDWYAKVEYIRMNPVRAKLVQRPEDWPYSSAHGNFTLDPLPARYIDLTSGAKAQNTSPLTPGLKPRPPKEENTAERARTQTNVPKPSSRLAGA
jgi:putative transposase